MSSTLISSVALALIRSELGDRLILVPELLRGKVALFLWNGYQLRGLAGDSDEK